MGPDLAPRVAGIVLADREACAKRPLRRHPSQPLVVHGPADALTDPDRTDDDRQSVARTAGGRHLDAS